MHRDPAGPVLMIASAMSRHFLEQAPADIGRETLVHAGALGIDTWGRSQLVDIEGS